MPADGGAVQSNWASIIEAVSKAAATVIDAVKTPLGLAALIVLVGAALVGYLLYRAPPRHRETARLVRLLLVILGVLAVGALGMQTYLEAIKGNERKPPLTTTDAEDLVGNDREAIIKCLAPLACKKIRFEFARGRTPVLHRITAQLDAPRDGDSWTADATAASCVRNRLYRPLSRYEGVSDVFAEYVCERVVHEPPRERPPPCVIDGDYDTRWNESKPRCKDPISNPVDDEAEASEYRKRRGFERCESFIIYRCK